MEKQKMMKRLTLIIGIMLIGLSCAGCGKASDAAKGKVTMAELVEAGKHATVLKNHKSYKVSYHYAEDGFTYERYADAEVKCTTFDNGYTGLYINDELAYVKDGNVQYAMLGIHGAKILYDSIGNILFGEGSSHEVIKTYEEKEDRICISTELPTDKTKTYCETHGVTYQEGDVIRITYELDKETLELLTESDVIVSANGEEKVYVTTNVSYDVERTGACKELCQYMNANSDLRTVTFITDPGTEEEAEWSMQVPMEVGVFPYGGDDYINVYTDKECTQQLTESVEPYQDNIFYMKKGN